ncbi:MAG: hypothetical protein ABWY64_27305 [Tardiphaga sp.]
MIDHHAVWLAHQQARFMRHDARRWIRPDAARFLKPGTNPADVYLALKYSPTQRRIPAGRPGGGRWTDGDEDGGSGGGFGSISFGGSGDGATDGMDEAEGYEDIDDLSGSGELTDGPEVFEPEQPSNAFSNPSPPRSGREGINDSRVISDTDPETVRPGEQYAQAGGRRGGTSVRINGQTYELTVRQSAELQGVQAQAQGATARVHELDPNWKPTASEYQTVSGLIESYRADARQAQDRIVELSRIGIGPGPFAVESLPARGPERSFTATEHREINRIGSATGCQTCGTSDPGTPRGNFVIDHQPPTGLNSSGGVQRLYPHCLSCSLKQGGFVRSLVRGR